MRKLFSLLPVILFILIPAGYVLAQTPGDNDAVQMADGLRSNGKIWVVVAVFLLIVAGLVAYLVRLDGKIRRLENK